MTHIYLIALGSNKPHHKYGQPRYNLIAAAKNLEKIGQVKAISRIISSRPIGPSLRQYANGALILKSKLPPEDLLISLKKMEVKFGRRRGQSWSARALDLDIILWSGGCYGSDSLTIPHPLFAERDFVLKPAVEIAGNWRDPVRNLSIRQLLFSLEKPKPLL